MRNLAIGGAAALVVGIGLSLVLGSSYPVFASVAENFGFFAGIGGLGTAMLMILSSKVGKFRERDRLLGSIPWCGDETVLDVGCGRGLMLIGAAKRPASGKAAGVDIWQSEDQSGNHPEVTLSNARAEGVAERVEVRDGDARQLPFEDGTFGVVLSSLALHNIHDAEGRREAVEEIARVLKGSGRVAILDIWHTDQYEQVLRESGVQEVTRSGLRFFIYPPARVVSGVKPPLPGTPESGCQS
jgi:SAM-dependent methyltransferase